MTASVTPLRPLGSITALHFHFALCLRRPELRGANDNKADGFDLFLRGI